MPPLEIEYSPRFQKEVQDLSEERRQGVFRAIVVLRETFGKPHVQSGRGIRRLNSGLFECRVGRDLRILFEIHDDIGYLLLIGNHDEIRRQARR